MQEKLKGKRRRRRRRRSKKVLEYSKKNSRQWHFKQVTLDYTIWTSPLEEAMDCS
jgi:hypothetical protein